MAALSESDDENVTETTALRDRFSAPLVRGFGANEISPLILKCRKYFY
jgi:hypothetical protein